MNLAYHIEKENTRCTKATHGIGKVNMNDSYICNEPTLGCLSEINKANS